MKSFCKHLVKGEGRGEAPQNVQLEMLRSTNHRHPYYWAAFVTLGEWRPLSRPGDPEPSPLPRYGYRASTRGPNDGAPESLLVLLVMAHRHRRVRCGLIA